MIVHIPSPLQSYTGNQNRLELEASSLLELSMTLDCQFPGIRFRMIDEQDRIRQHIKIFVNKEEINHLNTPLSKGDVIHITCALSGG